MQTTPLSRTSLETVSVESSLLCRPEQPDEPFRRSSIDSNHHSISEKHAYTLFHWRVSGQLTGILVTACASQTMFTVFQGGLRDRSLAPLASDAYRRPNAVYLKWPEQFNICLESELRHSSGAQFARDTVQIKCSEKAIK